MEAKKELSNPPDNILWPKGQDVVERSESSGEGQMRVGVPAVVRQAEDRPSQMGWNQ